MFKKRWEKNSHRAYLSNASRAHRLGAKIGRTEGRLKLKLESSSFSHTTSVNPPWIIARLILLLDSVKFFVLLCVPQHYSISTQFALVTTLIYFHQLILYYLSYMNQIQGGVKSRLLFFRHFFSSKYLNGTRVPLPPNYGILNFHFFNLSLSDSTRILDSTMQLHRSILASVLTALLVSRLTLTTKFGWGER